MKLKKAPVVITVVSNGVALRLTALYDVLISIDRSVKTKNKKKKPKESNILAHWITSSRYSGSCFLSYLFSDDSCTILAMVFRVGLPLFDSACCTVERDNVLFLAT